MVIICTIQSWVVTKNWVDKTLQWIQMFPYGTRSCYSKLEFIPSFFFMTWWIDSAGAAKFQCKNVSRNNWSCSCILPVRRWWWFYFLRVEKMLLCCCPTTYFRGYFWSAKIDNGSDIYACIFQPHPSNKKQMDDWINQSIFFIRCNKNQFGNVNVFFSYIQTHTGITTNLAVCAKVIIFHHKPNFLKVKKKKPWK